MLRQEQKPIQLVGATDYTGGTNGSINIPQASLGSVISTQNCTLCAWIYIPNAPSGNNNVFSFADGTHFQSFLTGVTPNHFGLNVDASGLITWTGLVLASWTFVYMTGTPSVATGNSRRPTTGWDAGGTRAPSATTTGMTLIVGNNFGAAIALQGYICHYQARSYPMSQSDLFRQSSQLAPINEAGLVSYKPMRGVWETTRDQAINRLWTSSGSLKTISRGPPVPELSNPKSFSLLLGASSQTFSPPGIVEDNPLGLASGAAGLSPPGIAVDNPLGIPSGASGAAPPAIPTEATFSAPSGASNVAPPAISTDEVLSNTAFGSSLSPPGIGAEDKQSLSGTLILGLSDVGIYSSEVFGQKTLSPNLSPPGIPPAEVLVSNINSALSGVGIDPSEVVAPGALGLGLAPGVIPSSEVLGPEVAALALTPAGIGSDEQLSPAATGAIAAAVGIPSGEVQSSETLSSTLTSVGIPPAEAVAASIIVIAVSVVPIGPDEALCKLTTNVTGAWAPIVNAEPQSPGAFGASLVATGIAPDEMLSRDALSAAGTLPGLGGDEVLDLAKEAIAGAPPGIGSDTPLGQSSVAPGVLLVGIGIDPSEALGALRAAVGPAPVPASSLLFGGGGEDNDGWSPDEYAAHVSGARKVLDHPGLDEYVRISNRVFDSALDFLVKGRAGVSKVAGDFDIEVRGPAAGKKEADYVVVPIGKYGSDVRTAAAGRVTFVVDKAKGGLCAQVKGDDGNHYLHVGLSESVGSPRWVRAGEVIGKMGALGEITDLSVRESVAAARAGSDAGYNFDTLLVGSCVSLVFLVLGQPEIATVTFIGALLYARRWKS
jgi:hypothetical protein